jgi:hypothetical protein
MDAIAQVVFRNAHAIRTLDCVACTASAQAPRVVFVRLVRTIVNSIAKPVIRNALLEFAAAFEVVSLTTAILFVAIVLAIWLAVAHKALVHALLFVGALEHDSIVAGCRAIFLVTKVMAVVLFVASVSGEMIEVIS